MTSDKIKNYFGEKTVYKFTGPPNQIVQLLIEKEISINYIVVDNITYLITSEPLTDILDNQLSIFSTPIGI